MQKDSLPFSGICFCLRSRAFWQFVLVSVVGGWLLGCSPSPLPSITPVASASVTSTPVPMQSSPPAISPTPTSAVQVREEQLQGVSIHFWHPYSDGLGSIFDQAAEEFSRSNPWGIHVNSQAFNGVDRLDEQMKQVISWGELPHLVIAPLYYALRWHMEKPVLAEWTPYVNDPLWGLSISEQKQFYPNLWETAWQDEHRLGIPARRVAQLIFYNASWARELGFDAAPSTPDAFMLQACAVRVDGKQEGDAPAKGYLFLHDYPTVLGWLIAFGAPIVDREHQRYQFESKAVEEALIYLRTLYEQGCTHSLGDSDPVEMFVHRRVLLAPGSSAQLNAIAQAMKYQANPDRWTVLPLPTLDGQGATVLYGTDFVLIRSSSSEQLAAWLFVRWLLREEKQYQVSKATLGLPLHRGAGEALKGDPDLSPEFRAAIGYLPIGVQEPLWASWDTVRWAVSDASRQLVAWYFTLDQVPSLVRLLEKTAASLHAQSP